MTALQPATGDTDTQMYIDEEGKPRFEPAKNTVRKILPNASSSRIASELL
jgi:hypothetical protein